jgi:hypothetical protein
LLLLQFAQEHLEKFAKQNRVAASDKEANCGDGSLAHGQALTVQLDNQAREYLSVKADQTAAEVVQDIAQNIQCLQLN